MNPAIKEVLMKIEREIVDTLQDTNGCVERRNLPSDGYDHMSGPRGLIARGYVELVGYNGSCVYYRAAQGLKE